jgi:glycosyltransferase involved in cell wall biosynthesis
VRILFVNHTGAWSGAEVALLRLVASLRDEHEVVVACPPGGPLAAAVDRAGVRRLDVPAFEASLRLHPVRTPVGLAQLAVAALALVRLVRRVRPDVVHANTPRAGLMAAPARRLGGPPVVVRAHEHVPSSATGRAVRAVLLHSASAVVAVSDSTALRFDEGLGRRVAERVYNPVDLDRFDPARVAPSAVRTERGIPAGAPLLGQVAQITPWKGQDTAIRALAGLRRAGLGAHLLLVGEIAFAGKGVRHDNHGFRRRLDELVAELGVGDAVHFLGAREDVPALLAAMDLSLLPSWEEPFGLVTVESMAMGTPPLVSAVGGGPELVQDGVTGRLLDPHRPEAWTAAARTLLEDDAARARMGAAGRATAARFREDAHARAILAVYERVLERGAPRWLS